MLISKSLNPGGKAYIIIPSQRFKGETFLGFIESSEFELEKIPLDTEFYSAVPLKDQQLGLKTYPGLKELSFWVYVLTRK